MCRWLCCGGNGHLRPVLFAIHGRDNRSRVGDVCRDDGQCCDASRCRLCDRQFRLVGYMRVSVIELSQRYQNGDEQCCCELFVVHHGNVHSYDLGMCRWFPKMYNRVGKSALLAVATRFRVCVGAITYHLVFQHHRKGFVR